MVTNAGRTATILDNALRDTIDHITVAEVVEAETLPHEKVDQELITEFFILDETLACERSRIALKTLILPGSFIRRGAQRGLRYCLFLGLRRALRFLPQAVPCLNDVPDCPKRQRERNEIADR